MAYVFSGQNARPWTQVLLAAAVEIVFLSWQYLPPPRGDVGSDQDHLLWTGRKQLEGDLDVCANSRLGHTLGARVESAQ